MTPASGDSSGDKGEMHKKSWEGRDLAENFIDGSTTPIENEKLS